VPFLQGVTGEGVTGASALIGQHRDLVHQVGMLRQQAGMVSVASQTYSEISQGCVAQTGIRCGSRLQIFVRPKERG
jgi:hypothetical protein